MVDIDIFICVIAIWVFKINGIRFCYNPTISCGHAYSVDNGITVCITIHVKSP